MEINEALANFVRDRRKDLQLTQEQLAARAGVGLRFLRELEQGKQTLRMDKVNQVLGLFSAELMPLIKQIPTDEDASR